MKKLSLLKTVLLLCALVVGSSNVWADNNVSTVKTSFNSTGDVTSNFTQTGDFKNVAWDLDVTWKKSVSWQSMNDTKGSQVGSGSNPASQIVLTGSGVSGTITSIVINTSMASQGSGTIEVKVGDIDFKCNNNTTASLTTSPTDYTFTGSGSGNIVITWKQPTTSKAFYIKSVTTTFSSGDDPDPEPVAVTGVELDQTSLTMEIGDEETLTATVAPNDATTKTVTWSSDDEDVATVENGVVTAVGAGTCTITVTTTDGDFTATCDVTVNAAPVSNAAVTWDFSTNIFGFPESSSNKTTDSNNYTYGDYTINLSGGGTSNGYYYNTNGNYLLMGKTGCTLTFPAFGFNVSKIKVHGTSGASTGVTQNIYVGSTAVSTETTGAKNVINEYAIATEYQAAGNIYKFQVTSNANTQISKIEIIGYVEAEVGTNGYATFANGNKLDLSNLPEGLTAYKAAVDGDAVKFTAFDQAVPANTGMMLKGDASENPYKIPVIEESTDVTENAFLVNEDGETFEADANYNYFGLKKNTLTFGLFDPATVAIPASKAYLKVAKENPARELVCVFDDGETTGISEAKLLNNNEEIINNNFFDLQGRRVAQPTKGLYIMNGKKVIVK